ncbi:MAG: hypothetical protein PVI11_05320 [Candidatus Aminicenantes bacterium]|jgi:hypothetical protein
MTKTKSLIALSALAFFVVSLGALGVDASGDWEITSEGRQGTRTQDAHIEQDGENITVTMQGFRGNEMTGKGMIKGNEIEWSFNVSTQRGDFTITYKGKVEGDTMSGTVQMGDFGSREWTAKKK